MAASVPVDSAHGCVDIYSTIQRIVAEEAEEDAIYAHYIQRYANQHDFCLNTSSMEASPLVCSCFSFMFPPYFSQNLLFYFSFTLSTEVNGGLALYYAAFLKTPPSHSTHG